MSLEPTTLFSRTEKVSYVLPWRQGESGLKGIGEGGGGRARWGKVKGVGEKCPRAVTQKQ